MRRPMERGSWVTATATADGSDFEYELTVLPGARPVPRCNWHRYTRSDLGRGPGEVLYEHMPLEWLFGRRS